MSNLFGRSLKSYSDVLCGIGWGLSGYCPGPALVSLLYGYESTVVFCLAMFAGMALEGPLSRLVASS